MSLQKLFTLCFAMSCAAICLSNTPLRGDLVGYWNMDENVDDQSGSDNHGELFDGEYSDNVPSAIGSGQSISFEFDDQHIFVEADESLESPTFTLSMFVFDRGQEGAMERLTSREGDTFETAINVHGPFSGVGEYSYFSAAGGGWQWGDDVPPLEEWQHVAYVADSDNEELSIYVDGELTWTTLDPWFTDPIGFMHIGNRHNNVEGFDGLMDDVALWDEVLSDADIKTIATVGVARFLDPNAGGTVLQPGDADQDLDFDQLDLVKVQIAAKYLTGAAATWGDGDWNGAPGGSQGSPPAGDGFFNQGDIIAALNAAKYLTGPYAALSPDPGSAGDEQTSLVYDPSDGSLAVDAPAGKELTSINITSAGSKFIGDKPAVLDGAFDNFAADNVFKATFGGSFGDISFGNVLTAGLTSDEVVADLSAVGSLAGGGDLGNVDLVYVPEPSTFTLILVGLLGLCQLRRKYRATFV